MPANISHLASVDPRAEIADDVTIGPFCSVGPDVQIDRGTRLLGNVTLMGHVRIGRDNTIYPNAVLGGEPQDLSYSGSVTRVVIGHGNTIREGVTISRASEKEDGVTRIGNDNFLMANCHVAHDCVLGNQIILANGVLLAGHVIIYDHVSISGSAGVHHFATIGSYAFISGLSRVLHDVPPYMLAEGAPARPRCINIVALKRNNFPPNVINALAEAHRLIYRAKVGADHAREILRGNDQLVPQVNELLSFVQSQSEGRHGRSREIRRAA